MVCFKAHATHSGLKIGQEIQFSIPSTSEIKWVSWKKQMLKEVLPVELLQSSGRYRTSISDKEMIQTSKKQHVQSFEKAMIGLDSIRNRKQPVDTIDLIQYAKNMDYQS